MIAKRIIFALLILIALVVIIYIIAQGIRIKRLLDNSAVLVQKSVPYQQHPTKSTKTILVVGDSTAVGTGSTTNADSVAGRFGAMFPHATVINQGINGQKIHQLNTSFSPAVEPHADLLIIQIGGNDILRLTPNTQIQSDLDELLQNAVKVGDKVVIMHSGNVGLSPFWPKLFAGIWSKKSQQVHDIYVQEAAKYGVNYVDLMNNNSDRVFLEDPTRYYASDFIHPSSSGYLIWFDSILAVLKQKYGQNFLGK